MPKRNYVSYVGKWPTPSDQFSNPIVMFGCFWWTIRLCYAKSNGWSCCPKIMRVEYGICALIFEQSQPPSPTIASSAASLQTTLAGFRTPVASIVNHNFFSRFTWKDTCEKNPSWRLRVSHLQFFVYPVVCC